MQSNEAETIADALGAVLQRRFRQAVYATLTRDLHPAVDDTTYPVISGVGRMGPISSVALAGEIGLDRSVVSRRAAELGRAGLLRSNTDPVDGRARSLVLTVEGAEVVAIMRRRLAEVVDRHVSGWTSEERREFARLFAKFASGPVG